MNKVLNLHLVSDSSGETVAAVGRAAITHFEGIEVIEYMWPLVRSIDHIDKILEQIEKKPSIVIYTMINGSMHDYLIRRCNEIMVPCISPIRKVIEVIEDYTNVTPTRNEVGKYGNLDENYFKKINNIKFTMSHDDGAGLESYNEADIVLLGVSRTSKSPTSLYLSHRGYMVANLPIIKGQIIDLSLMKKNSLVVGLTIDEEYLLQVRSNRFSKYNNKDLSFLANNYLSIDAIQEEISYAKEIFYANDIPIIDVTKKAIEEIAAEIINLLFTKRGDHEYSSFTL